MKIVLRFIYTGELDKAVFQTNIAEILTVTDEYELKDL